MDVLGKSSKSFLTEEGKAGGLGADTDACDAVQTCVQSTASA